MILSPLLALLLVLTSVLPVIEAEVSQPMAMAMTADMPADCPMPGGNKKSVPPKTCNFCVLCVTGSLAASSDSGHTSIPERFVLAARMNFATGVSATHGPEWTANPPTGPPAI